MRHVSYISAKEPLAALGGNALVAFLHLWLVSPVPPSVLDLRVPLGSFQCLSFWFLPPRPALPPHVKLVCNLVMFKVCIALRARSWLLLHALCDGGFQLFLWGGVHIPKQKGENPSFPEIKIKRDGATILLFAFQTEGVWFMPARSLCHSCAGAAVQCDPRLIPITTPGIDHISFVVTDGLPRGLLVFEPSHLASRPARAWCKNIVFSAQPEIHFCNAYL